MRRSFDSSLPPWLMAPVPARFWLRAFGLGFALMLGASAPLLSGTDIPLGGENETTIAVDPNNPLHLACASLHELRVSTDGGATFQPPVREVHPSGGFPTGVDPSLAYDSQGRLFWAWLSGRSELIVAQCDPMTGEILPGYPVIATGSIHTDKGWLAIDCSPSSPFLGRLHLAWITFQTVRTSYSTDQGMTWSPALGPLASTSWPVHNAVAPNGDVYIAYHTHPINPPNGTTGRVEVRRSTDGGVSYQTPTLAFPPGAADITQNIAARIPGTRFLTQGSWQPWVLPDPNTPGRLYVVACDDPDNVHGAGDDANIYMATSTDHGSTWSSPARVDDGPGTTFQVFPTASIDPTSGAIAVQYYDNRNGNLNSDGNFLLDVFTTLSLDGGATFFPEVQINDEPFDPDAVAPCSQTCGSYLLDAWGSSASDVYVVGWDGTIVHYDGLDWSYQASGTGAALWEVWGSGPDDVFAVGAGGTIRHYDGNAWLGQLSNTGQALYAVSGTAADDVFAVGAGGTILHYDGNSWSPQASGTSVILADVWANAPNDVWVVGEGNTVLHYDGSWSSLNVPSPLGVGYGVRIWGSSGNDVFAAGNAGVIFHYDGNSWSLQYSYAGRGFYGLWGSSGTDVFAVDNLGGILHYDGNVWSEMSPVSNGWQLWGSSGTDVFLAAEQSMIFHYDGVAWAEHGNLRPPSATLRIGEYNGVAIVTDQSDIDLMAVWCGNEYNAIGDPISQQAIFDRLEKVSVASSAPPSSSVFLSQNHPNPFRARTSIEVELPAAAHVTLRIYDAQGRLVRRLLDRHLAPNLHSIDWDGSDDRGHALASGVYWYRLGVGEQTETRPLVMVR